MIVVPPGGFAGLAQMTPSSRQALGFGGARAGRGSASGKRARRKAAKAAKRARRTTRGRKMKFGSPAWQKKYKVGKFAKRK